MTQEQLAEELDNCVIFWILVSITSFVVILIIF